jgi:hypothetical protein
MSKLSSIAELRSFTVYLLIYVILIAGALLVKKNAEPAVAASFLFCGRQRAAHSAAQVHLTAAGRQPET